MINTCMPFDLLCVFIDNGSDCELGTVERIKIFSLVVDLSIEFKSRGIEKVSYKVLLTLVPTLMLPT